MTDHTVPLETQPRTGPVSGRHPVNVGHLVMGVAFLGLALVWALIASGAVEGKDVRWLLPMPWVAAGVAGVLASILPSRRRRAETRERGWVDAPTVPPTATPAEPTAAAPTDIPIDTPNDENPEETR